MRFATLFLGCGGSSPVDKKCKMIVLHFEMQDDPTIVDSKLHLGPCAHYNVVVVVNIDVAAIIEVVIVVVHNPTPAPQLVAAGCMVLLGFRLTRCCDKDIPRLMICGSPNSNVSSRISNQNICLVQLFVGFVVDDVVSHREGAVVASLHSENIQNIRQKPQQFTAPVYWACCPPALS